jgi:chromosome partitioning protein
MFDFLNGIQDMTDAAIMGVLITKVDGRKNYYRQTRELLDSYESIHVFESFIHVDSAVEWAQDASKPVAVYKKNTRSAAEFKKLAEEVMHYGSR